AGCARMLLRTVGRDRADLRDRWRPLRRRSVGMQPAAHDEDDPRDGEQEQRGRQISSPGAARSAFGPKPAAHPHARGYQPETAQSSWRSLAASAAAAARKSSSPLLNAYSTEREATTSALAGPLVKARAMSAGLAPCAPTPGRSRIACGKSFRASAIARG